MGKLFYGPSTEPIELPDQLLHYVQVIASTKLRRNESFMLTWTSTAAGPERNTIWLQPAIPVRFAFSSVEVPPLVTSRLRDLAALASSSGGLVFDLDAWQAEKTMPAKLTAVA